LQLTMAKQETVIECQKSELEKLSEEVSRAREDLATKEQEYVEVSTELTKVNRELEEMNSVVRQCELHPLYRSLVYISYACQGLCMQQGFFFFFHLG